MNGQCECELAGWCARHQCFKTEHWHELCRTRPDYFRLWEQGIGPGQDQSPAVPPKLARRAVNFVQALLRHVRDRLRRVSAKTRRDRLAVCRTCALLDAQRMVCQAQDCGCYVELKARWRSEHCPLAKWPGDVPAPEPVPVGAQQPLMHHSHS